MRKKKYCASDVLQALEQMQQKTKIPLCVNPTGAFASLQLFSLQNHCIHLITGRDGEGGIGHSGEMFLRPRGAMQDREDQGVSDRKVSATETMFLIFQTPNSKRHGLICTSLRRTSKKEETATK